MFKLLGSAIKITLVVILVLVLGNWIEWNGKTVSDQVKTQMSAVSRFDSVSNARDVTRNAAKNVRNAADGAITSAATSAKATGVSLSKDASSLAARVKARLEKAWNKKEATASNSTVPAKKSNERISRDEQEKLRSLLNR